MKLSPGNGREQMLAQKSETAAANVQGDTVGLSLGCVDFVLDVPLSARFCSGLQLQAYQATTTTHGIPH